MLEVITEKTTVILFTNNCYKQLEKPDDICGKSISNFVHHCVKKCVAIFFIFLSHAKKGKRKQRNYLIESASQLCKSVQ